MNARQRTIGIFLSIAIGAWALPWLGGCSPEDDPAAEQPLEQTVTYLASPDLKGRSAGTPGGRKARQYIRKQFDQIGLEYWGRTSSYLKPFNGGTNVIGVLRGKDPVLAEQFVIVCAHYDHVGVRHGQVHPGAVDNASGTAALLAIAWQLHREGFEPRRSICFAAFDGEEEGFQGSRAFTKRGDFDASRIVGVINMDMLGRDSFDKFPRTIVAAGAPAFPQLAWPVLRASVEQRVWVVPFFASPINRMTDTHPFQNLRLPCMTFSCAWFEDVHTPADIAESVDYDALHDETQLVIAAVRALADPPAWLLSGPLASPAASRPDVLPSAATNATFGANAH